MSISEKIVRNYIVCGPFPYKVIPMDEEESFYIDYLQSLGGEANARLSPGLVIGDAKCVEVQSKDDGFVDLTSIYGEKFKDFWRLSYGVAYAFTTVSVDEDGWYVFLIGSEDYFTLYVNGERVATSHIARRYEDSFYAIPVKLVKGDNNILLKIARLAGGWGFSLKIVKPMLPVYINVKRAITPEVPPNSLVSEWIGLNVLALEDVTLSIECVENELWNFCKSEETHLKAGERTQIPLFIISKKPIETDTNLSLRIVINQKGVYHINIPIKISKHKLHRVHTYRSKYDGSVHRYGVKIPVNYDANKCYPAILILHGFKGIQMYSEIYGDKDWVISVGITARDGEVNYREIAMLEVLEVLDDMSKRYCIDFDKVFLMGHSMGGYGTWNIGVRFPHIFAAIAPHAGRGDLSNTIAKLSMYDGWKGIAKLLDMYNPMTFIENLLNTPVYIAHGSEDNIVPVEYSRSMAKKLSELGIEFIYEEIPGKPHWWGSYTPGSYYGSEAIDRPALEKFFREKMRRVPSRVVAVTDSTRFKRVWWVSINDITYSGIAKIDVEVVLGKNTIRVNSIANVNEFSIDIDYLLSKGLLLRGDVVVEYLNSKVVVPRNLISKELVVRIYGDTICAVFNDLEMCSDGVKRFTKLTKGVVKLPNKNVLPGPFMDIFNGRVVIVPCSESSYAEMCRKIALHIQYWWNDYANGITRIINENEINSVDESEVNVIAIGGPEVNRYVDNVITYVKPVRITSNIIEVAGKRFEGEQYGIAFVYPNPRAEYRKYVGVLGGNSFTSISELYKLDLTMIPDYIVYDAKNLGKHINGIVYSGFFNVYWM